MRKLRIVYVPVGEAACVKEIADDLQVMQELVKGYIETVRITDCGAVFDDCRIVCNDEGYIRKMKKNKLGIYGPFFIISNQNAGDGEMVGLEEGKAQMIAAVLNSNGG